MAQDTNYVGAGPNAAHLFAGFKLLDAAGATGSSEWIDLQGFAHGSLHLSGTFVGAVDLHLSNAAARPASSDDGFVVLAMDQNAKMGKFQMPARWAKAKVAAYTSGSITANLHLTTVGS